MKHKKAHHIFLAPMLVVTIKGYVGIENMYTHASNYDSLVSLIVAFYFKDKDPKQTKHILNDVLKQVCLKKRNLFRLQFPLPFQIYLIHLTLKWVERDF